MSGWSKLSGTVSWGTWPNFRGLQLQLAVASPSASAAVLPVRDQSRAPSPLDCGWVVMWSTYAATSGSPETLGRNFGFRR